MPTPRKTSALRRLFKQLILCISLAAILQYAVAVAFSLKGSYGNRRHSWSLGVSEGPLYAAVYVYEHPTFGRDVLIGSFQFATNRQGVPVPDTMPDWSRAEWLNEFQTASRLADPSEKMPPPQPPAWSRIAIIRNGSTFDYAGGQPQPGDFLEIASGWPMRSATCFVDICPTIVRDNYRVRGGWQLTDPPIVADVTPRAIPLTIDWPGAIVNTLTYAALLVIPFILAPLLRRYLRRRAGRCPDCNYDLRATTTGTCPECGAAITPRATT